MMGRFAETTRCHLDYPDRISAMVVDGISDLSLISCLLAYKTSHLPRLIAIYNCELMYPFSIGMYGRRSWASRVEHSLSSPFTCQRSVARERLFRVSSAIQLVHDDILSLFSIYVNVMWPRGPCLDRQWASETDARVALHVFVFSS